MYAKPRIQFIACKIFCVLFYVQYNIAVFRWLPPSTTWPCSTANAESTERPSRCANVLSRYVKRLALHLRFTVLELLFLYCSICCVLAQSFVYVDRGPEPRFFLWGFCMLCCTPVSWMTTSYVDLKWSSSI